MERKADHATANRIYDEFDPVFNWKSEQGFEILTINLPGIITNQQSLVLHSLWFLFYSWFLNCVDRFLV